MRLPSLISGLVAAGAAGGYVFLWFHGGDLDPTVLKLAVVGLGYLFLLGSSGHLWNLVDWWLDDEEKRQADDENRPEATDGGQMVDGASEAQGNDEADEDSDDGPVSDRVRTIGTVIGKCENVLVPTFMLVGAHTGLAIIFAAKGIVRQEEMKKKSRYYLAGTLVNFTYSVAVGAVLAAAVSML